MNFFPQDSSASIYFLMCRRTLSDTLAGEYNEMSLFISLSEFSLVIAQGRSIFLSVE